jgi:hypothetical protein
VHGHGPAAEQVCEGLSGVLAAALALVGRVDPGQAARHACPDVEPEVDVADEGVAVDDADDVDRPHVGVADGAAVRVAHQSLFESSPVPP